MSTEEFIESWEREERLPFTGWDFSHLKGRMIEDPLPWDYMVRAVELMQRSSAVLDMGTGGGEKLLELRPFWPPKVVATEDYPPNFKLASERLGSLGVQVVKIPLTRTGLMPFGDGEFDLILNRHSGLNCSEVARMLAPGGLFLSQQVHGLWAKDLLAEFGARPQWPDATPAYYLPRFEKAGLALNKLEEWRGNLTFTDVGAIVYYLKAVPWLVPGFSVDAHLEVLLRLQDRIEKEGKLVFEARMYLMEYQEP